MRRRIFPEGWDGIGENGGVTFADMCWSRLKDRDAGMMSSLGVERVFPFLRTMAEDGTAHATHVRRALYHSLAGAAGEGS